MCVSCISFSPLHEGSLGYTVTDGKASITDYAGKNKHLIIPETLGGYEVVGIRNRAFFYATSLITLELPDSITTIGDSAFNRCHNLRRIKIGNSVTSIGDYPFTSCWALEMIEIPDSVTDIGNLAFVGAGLIKINENNSVYGFIDGVLFDKKQNILHKYPRSSEETSYVVPDFVTSIADYAFFGCRNLTEVKIPDSVTSIGHRAFEECNSLTEIVISNSIERIGDRVFAYSGLITIEIPETVTVIGNRALANCHSLTEVRISNTVTTIGKDVFAGSNNVMLVIEAEGSYAHKYAQKNKIDYVIE